MKKVLLAIIPALFVYGIVYSATYTDISPQRTETQTINEKEIEVDIDTPDNEKTIEKEWQEVVSDKFTVEDKQRDLETAFSDIDNAINYYNSIVDDLTEAKTSLNLDIEIPAKLTNFK